MIKKTENFEPENDTTKQNISSELKKDTANIVTFSSTGNTSIGSGTGKNDKGSILLAILFAFFGGIILNLMPCVFTCVITKNIWIRKNRREKIKGKH